MPTVERLVASHYLGKGELIGPFVFNEDRLATHGFVELSHALDLAKYYVVSIFKGAMAVSTQDWILL